LIGDLAAELFFGAPAARESAAPGAREFPALCARTSTTDARHKLLMARPASTGFNMHDIDARFLPD
jgi:hypothetical protein